MEMKEPISVIYKQFDEEIKCRDCNWGVYVLFDAVTAPTRTLRYIKRNGKCANCFMSFVIANELKLIK